MPLLNPSIEGGRKGEVKTPLFSYLDVALCIFASVVGGGGFGSRLIAESAFLGLLALLSLKSKNSVQIAIVLLGISGIFAPAILQCELFLVALLIISGKPFIGLILCLCTLSQMIGCINPFYIPAFGILFSLLLVLNKDKVNKISKTCLWVSISILAYTAFLQIPIPQGQSSFAFPYQIDPSSFIGKPYTSETYTSIDNKGDWKSAKVLVLEHDAPEPLRKFNWSQKRLWTENQLFGTPVLRIAVALDGYLFSNLGSRVDNSFFRFLGEAHYGESNSFISMKKGQFIFSDSDFLTNGAIGYQSNLINSLFQSYSLSHLIFLFSVICSFLSLILPSPWLLITCIAITSTISIAVPFFTRCDVRIVSNTPIWPHSQGVFGLGNEPHEKDTVITTARYGQAKVLGVARNAIANHLSEKVVVLEGGAKVKIGDQVWQALDLPLGECDGIIDALPLQQIGAESKLQPRATANGVLIIGTNSARKNSEEIFSVFRKKQ